MFRITKDVYLDMYYLHKKFLWFWVKYSAYNIYGYKKNAARDYSSLRKLFEQGRLDFSTGEYADYYYLSPAHAKIMYVKNFEDFFDQYAEYFI